MFLSRMLESFADEYAFMIKKKKPDGAGGFITTWEESEDTFTAIRQHDTTIEARIAEKDGSASTYTFFVDINTELEANDVIKNKKSGEVYMITSNAGDKITPAMSNLHMTSVDAKRWELTK